MSAATDCINFEVGDKVDFDLERFENQDFFEKSREQYGEGPFRIVKIKFVLSRAEKSLIGHHQIVILSHEKGEIIKNYYTQEPCEWSGRCLKKSVILHNE